MTRISKLLFSSIALSLLAACSDQSTTPTDASSASSPAATDASSAVSATTISGTVSSSNGPEAGVWVVAETGEFDTFFARIVLSMKNELGTKIVEIDARPSDSMVLALHAKKTILVARKVMDSVEDMTEILERILKQQN